MRELDKVSQVPGPGEVLCELNLGLKIKVFQGELTPQEHQEYFSRIEREVKLLAAANPGIPWDTGSTQVRALEAKLRRL